MFASMNRALIALAVLGSSACSNDADAPIFCEDSRSAVVMLNVSETAAASVDAVAVSGSGCRQADLTCHADWHDGNCQTYHVEVSLADDESEGVCQISVTYSDDRAPDALQVPVSMSDCGPVAGVDGEYEFDLPLSSGGAGGGVGAGGGQMGGAGGAGG